MLVTIEKLLDKAVYDSEIIDTIELAFKSGELSRKDCEDLSERYGVEVTVEKR